MGPVPEGRHMFVFQAGRVLLKSDHTFGTVLMHWLFFVYKKRFRSVVGEEK